MFRSACCRKRIQLLECSIREFSSDFQEYHFGIHTFEKVTGDSVGVRGKRKIAYTSNPSSLNIQGSNWASSNRAFQCYSKSFRGGSSVEVLHVPNINKFGENIEVVSASTQDSLQDPMQASINDNEKLDHVNGESYLNFVDQSIGSAGTISTTNVEHDLCWFLFSDVHFHPTYLEDLQETTTWIKNEVQKYNPTQIICLGDLINTRETVSVQALSAAVRFIDDLSTQAPVHILLGNHDMNLKHSHKISSLDILDTKRLVYSNGASRINIYRGIQFTILDGFKVCMAAYHENNLQTLRNHLKLHHTLDSSSLSNTILFSHMAIQGAIMSYMKDQKGCAYQRRFDEEISKSTNEALSSNPIFSRDLSKHELCEDESKTISQSAASLKDSFISSDKAVKSVSKIPKFLTHFKRVFSGHFHHHHSISPTITYCGAPMQHHFGDAGDSERGVIIYYPKTDEIKFLRNPHWDRFRMIRLTNSTDEEVLLRNIETYRNKHVSIGSTFSAINYNIERLNQALIHHGAKSVRIQPVKLYPSDMISQDAISTIVPNVMNTSKSGSIEGFHELLVEYARENNLTEEMIKKGLEIITKTLETPGVLECYHTGEIFRGNLESITIENFLSIQGRVEIPLNQMKPGVWYIQGDNGSGKSAIFEAVSWALLDRFLRSDMKADFAINDVVQKDCRVRLKFSNGYEIERFRKYKALGGNGVRVYKNGNYQVEMEKGHIRDSQKLVEELIGIDFETFSKSIILSDQAIVFLAQDSKRRREFVERLLGMSIFDRFLETVKEERKTIDQEKTAIEARINLLQQQLKDAEHDEVSLRNIEELNSNLDASKITIEKLKVDLKKLREEERPQLLEMLDELKIEWNDCTNYINIKKFANVKVDLQLLQNEEKTIGNKIDQLQSKITDISKDMFLIEEKIRNFKTVIERDHCITCDSKIDKEKSKLMQSTIQDELHPQLQQLNEQLSNAHDENRILQTKKNELLQKRIKLSMDLSQLSTTLGILPTDEVTVPKISPVWYYEESFPEIYEKETLKLKEKENALEKQQLRLEENYQATNLLIHQHTMRNLSEREKLLQQITTQRELLVSITELKPLLQFWEQSFSPKTKKDFSSMRSYMINRSIQDLNKILKYYSNMLTVSYDKSSKPDLVISFDSEFQVNEAYGKRSAGQRKRNQLVIFFSLFELVRQRSRFQSNFLMLDEVFDALDQNGQEDVLSCIKILCNQPNLSYIFVITHSPDTLQNVPRDFIMDVKTSHNGSHYYFKTDNL